MKRIYLLGLPLVFTLLFCSCKKVEGSGGSSTITGKVHAEVYDGAGNKINEYDIPKEDVFIIYGGENTTFDDDVETSFDGTFKFEFLEEGNYQLFVYEKCTSCPSGKDIVTVDVEIKEKKSVVDVGTITIRK